MRAQTQPKEVVVVMKQNYKYDDHGNWIYRVYVGNGELSRQIETREIIYCNSADEVKSRLVEEKANWPTD